MQRTLMMSAAAAILASAGAASAQTTQPGAAPAETIGLEEIIVTAQRRSENLQRVAVPVSAITGRDLENASVSDTTNLTRLVPSLVVQPAGGNTTFYLRGVGSLSANAFAENAIAFSVGGVYFGRPTSPVGNFYDLERIEVVKGPQGTLYGRNATGGAINVLPNRPVLGDFEASVSAEIGNYQHRKLAGTVNLPIGETAALRLAGQAVDHDGYLSDGYDDEEGRGARASLLWKPNDVWSVLLVADYFKQGGQGAGSVTVPSAFYPAGPGVDERIGGSDPRSVAALTSRFAALVTPGLVTPPRSNGFLNNEFWGVAATIEADLGFGTLTVLPAYRSSKPDFLFYSTGFGGRVSETVDQTSVEVRLASSGDAPLQYVAGAFLYNEDQDASNQFTQGGLSTTFFAPQLSTESRAVFGQATYAVTERLRLVAGGRYTEEEKSLSSLFRQSSTANPNPPFLTLTGDLSFDSFTYKAGLEFDAGPASLIYANIATGFKAGGFFPSVGANTFEPEELTAYTLGSKNRFLDSRLQLNIEAFYWDYQDQQVTYNGPIRASNTGVFTQASITTNVGQATMRGVEVDLQFQVTPDGLFTANAQYLDAQYESFVYNGISATGAPPRIACPATLVTSLPVAAPARIFTVDCSGKPAINAPKWTINLGYEHTFAITTGFELTAGVRTRFETSRYLSIEYLDEQRQKSYAMSDVFLTLEPESEAWSLTGFVNNIQDETVYATSIPRPILGAVYNGLRPPRTYGVRATARF